MVSKRYYLAPPLGACAYVTRVTCARVRVTHSLAFVKALPADKLDIARKSDILRKQHTPD